MRTIRLNDYLANQLDLLAIRFAARTGERPVDVRRGLELTLVQRGLEAIDAEITAAEQAEAERQKRALG